MAESPKRGYAAVRMGKGGFLSLAAGVLALTLVGGARADDWWPHPADATWTYQWTDSVYNQSPTKEKITVKDQSGKNFTLSWTTKDVNPDGALLSFGDMAFQDTTAGLINTDWASNPPPPDFPILCPQIGGCNNSLASTMYYMIWGSRSPVLAAPLLKGTTWQGTGGAQNDVSSTSTYEGQETVKVPAFPDGVMAAKVTTEATQAGALGDPYGSGVRTVWWVYGVGPVKIVFQHSGGTGAPVTTALLQKTNQTAQPPPVDIAYFPLQPGLKGTYAWTNAKHFKKPEVESFSIDQAANGTAIFKVQSVSGPMKVAGAYQFSTRLDGVTSVSSATKAASLANLPPLGPKSLPPTKRRHFFTPFDLMTFGFNPVIPAYPAAGASWASDPNSRDFSVYGVNGASRVVGVQRVKTPIGTFDALVVTSALSQPGYPFGSGTRTMWFAPGKGLVKLVFRHGDHSVSTVVRTK